MLQGVRRRPAGEGRRSRADARHRRRPARAEPVGVGVRRGKAKLGGGPRRGAERRAPGRELGGPDSPPPGRPCPKFALVDNETGAATDPGPCVELARARRIEQVSYHTVMGLTSRTRRAPTVRQRPARARQVPEQRRLHRAVRRDPGGGDRRRRALPSGAALRRAPRRAGAGRRRRRGRPGTVARGDRLHLGRRRAPCSRASRTRSRRECRATARCPRLPDRNFEHLCFGLPKHGLAPTCAPSGC